MARKTYESSLPGFLCEDFSEGCNASRLLRYLPPGDCRGPGSSLIAPIQELDAHFTPSACRMVDHHIKTFP